MGAQILSGIYLSYADEDTERAEFIRSVLVRHGIETRVHADYLRKSEIRDAMDSSACILFLLTPNARRSERVLDNLIYARSNKYQGRILALLAQGDLETAVPYGLLTWPISNLLANPSRVLERLITTLWDIEDKEVGAVEIPDIPDFMDAEPPAPPRPIAKTHDVYLSYRHLDKQYMPAMRDALLDGGLTVWVDQLILPGGDWRTELENAIDGARTVVVLLSERIGEGSWVLEDIAYAEAHNIPIFPVALDKSPYKSDTPYDLSDRAYVEWYIDAPEDERQASIKRLLEGIQTTITRMMPKDRADVMFTPDINLNAPNSAEKMWDAFLSYSRKDGAVMTTARDTLRGAGFAIWTDEALVPGTPDWEAEIEKALRDTLSVVVLLSPDSASSEWVRRELAFAEEQKVRILPILVRGEPSAAVPIRLIATQRVDGRTNLNGALQQIVKGLTSYKSRP